jgi:hypothetical protein
MIPRAFGPVITKIPPRDEVLRRHRRPLTEHRPEHKLNRDSAARRHRTVSLFARLITVSSVGECNEESDQSDIVLLDIALADRFDYSETIAAKNRAYIESTRNTIDVISSHIETVRAAMKAVAPERATIAAGTRYRESDQRRSKINERH